MHCSYLRLNHLPRYCLALMAGTAPHLSTSLSPLFPLLILSLLVFLQYTGCICACYVSSRDRTFRFFPCVFLFSCFCGGLTSQPTQTACTFTLRLSQLPLGIIDSLLQASLENVVVQVGGYLTCWNTCGHGYGYGARAC